MMDRRAFIVGGVTAVAAPLGAGAQGVGKIPRIGYVQVDLPVSVPLREAFLAGLRDLGWVDGRTIILDWRKMTMRSASLCA
jgi:hypothetical protein